jgi:hypothetical protein
MPTLSQSDRLGSGPWADTFPSGTGNRNELFGEQSWLVDQYQFERQLGPIDQSPGGQFEQHDVLSNVLYFSFSSISASPDAVRLQRNLQVHGQGLETMVQAEPRRTSILDFPPLVLGTVLRPLGPDDDLLGEMMADDAWS